MNARHQNRDMHAMKRAMLAEKCTCRPWVSPWCDTLLVTGAVASHLLQALAQWRTSCWQASKHRFCLQTLINIEPYHAGMPAWDRHGSIEACTQTSTLACGRASSWQARKRGTSMGLIASA